MKLSTITASLLAATLVSVSTGFGTYTVEDEPRGGVAGLLTVTVPSPTRRRLEDTAQCEIQPPVLKRRLTGALEKCGIESDVVVFIDPFETEDLNRRLQDTNDIRIKLVAKKCLVDGEGAGFALEAKFTIEGSMTDRQKICIVETLGDVDEMQGLAAIMPEVGDEVLIAAATPYDADPPALDASPKWDAESYKASLNCDGHVTVLKKTEDITYEHIEFAGTVDGLNASYFYELCVVDGLDDDCDSRQKLMNEQEIIPETANDGRDNDCDGVNENSCGNVRDNCQGTCEAILGFQGSDQMLQCSTGCVAPGDPMTCSAWKEVVNGKLTFDDAEVYSGGAGGGGRSLLDPGHVTVLKARAKNNQGSEEISCACTSNGHVTVLK